MTQPDLAITNRWLYQTGESSRYTLIDDVELWVYRSVVRHLNRKVGERLAPDDMDIVLCG